MTNVKTISKNRISELLELFSNGDNADFKLELFDGLMLSKRSLVEAKVQIDRWNTVTTQWIFHSSKEQMVISLFEKDNVENLNTSGIKEALKVVVKYSTALDLNKNVDDLTGEELKSLFKINNSSFRIWGADVIFTDNIDPHMGIGLSVNNDDTLRPNDSGKLANSIVVFDIP